MRAGPRAPERKTGLDTDSALAIAMAAGEVQGSVEGVSTLDGKDRLSAFRRVDRYPLYVIAGIDRTAVVASWQRRLAVLAAFTFPISMALMYVVWIALRRTRRELLAQQSLAREVEQRARVESALHHVQKLEALGRLTGGVAHDFNNLLTIVSNNLHLMHRLDSKLVDNKQLAAIGRAVASGERLTRQLLAFARRQPLQLEVVSIQERLPALLALIAPTLGPRIQSEMEIDAETRSVLIDAAELELAVINLAVNAKDAMPDGGRLTLSARNSKPGEIDIAGQFVVLTVADTGTGIDPALSERVFEPFFTTKPAGQGTGLGLSQVYGLCAQAGGTVRIDTAPGSGTRVELYLPATDPPPPPGAAVANRDRSQAELQHSSGGGQRRGCGCYRAAAGGSGMHRALGIERRCGARADRCRSGQVRPGGQRHGDAWRTRWAGVSGVPAEPVPRHAGDIDDRLYQPVAGGDRPPIYRVGQALPTRRAYQRDARGDPQGNSHQGDRGN